MNLPNALTLVRMFLVPLLVVVLLTEFEGRRILGVPKELVGAAIFGAGVAHRLARRLPGAPPAAGDVARADARSDRRQAADVGGVHLAGAARPGAGVDGGAHHRPRVRGHRRCAASRTRAGITIPASPLGKIKMASQVTAILLLILGWGPLPWLAPLGHVALWVVMVAAVVSAVDYYRRFQRLLNARVTDVNIARRSRKHDGHDDREGHE